MNKLIDNTPSRYRLNICVNEIGLIARTSASNVLFNELIFIFLNNPYKTNNPIYNHKILNTFDVSILPVKAYTTAPNSSVPMA